MSNEWVNPTTGEVADEFLVIRRGKYPRKVGFVTMFTDGFDFLAKQRLTTTQCSVLFALLARLDYENWVAIAQETIAQDLAIDRADINKAVQKLVEIEVIFVDRDPTDKRRVRYRLNGALGWRRKSRQLGTGNLKAASNVIPLPGVALARKKSPRKKAPHQPAPDTTAEAKQA